MRFIAERAVEDRLLDGFELPSVVLRFDIQAYFAVVVLFASDERISGISG